MLPLISREQDRTVYGEYMGEGTVAPLVMIRRGRYKYVHCDVDSPQLFNLAADPDELHNLVADPEYAGVASGFAAEVAEHWDLETIRREVIASQHRRRFVSRALMTGRHTPWDYEPRQDAANRFMRNHLDLNEVEAKSRFPVPPYPRPLDGSGY
jgi:choline-sulfatase